MASLRFSQGYDFVESPSKDYFCPVTSDLLHDPCQTLCCGNHISYDAFWNLQRERKPCPLCVYGKLSAIRDLYHKRKVMSLKVRCPHKAEGCEWEGELGSLERHLSTNSAEGECQFVEVNCPDSCGERVPRRGLEQHRSQHCPKRPFTCQYCNHVATHQEVTEEHWPVCEKYPLPCPNECGEKEMERQQLKGHLEQSCPLEVVECEFSYAGCGAQLQRHLMPAHMKENMEAHLSLVGRVNSTLLETVQRQEEQIEQQRDQLQLQMKVAYLLASHNTINVPPNIFRHVRDFSKHKRRNEVCNFAPFYSHVGGYKMFMKAYPNGCGEGVGTHLSVGIYIIQGEFDDHLKWPFRGEITLRLKRRQLPYFQKTITLGNRTLEEIVCKPRRRMNRGFGCHTLISHSELSAGGFLRDNTISFCIASILPF